MAASGCEIDYRPTGSDLECSIDDIDTDESCRVPHFTFSSACGTATLKYRLIVDANVNSSLLIDKFGGEPLQDGAEILRSQANPDTTSNASFRYQVTGDFVYTSIIFEALEGTTHLGYVRVTI